MTAKKYHGAAKFNNQKTIPLGYATIEILQSRFVAEQRKFSDAIENGQLALAADKHILDGLMNGSINKVVDPYEGLLIQPVTFTEDDESLVPGVSMPKFVSMLSTPEYEYWAMLATQPSKRFGLDQDALNAARVAWETLAPEIAPFYPKWVDRE